MHISKAETPLQKNSAVFMNGLAPLSQENKKAIFFLVTYDITRHSHHKSAFPPTKSILLHR